MATRSHGLDVLRAAAIIGVMLYHAFVMGFGSPCPSIAIRGWMGVDLFFVLSGFLIGGQFFKACVKGESPNAGSFYARRALRILPAYLTIVFLYFALPSWRETPAIQPLWQFLTFTENLLIDYSSDRAFSHVWSLCVEEHFYLVFPLLFWLLMRRPSFMRAVILCLVIVGGGIFMRGYAWLHSVASSFDSMEGVTVVGPAYFEKVYYPSLLRLDGILAGVGSAGIKYFRPSWWQAFRNRRWVLIALGVIGASVTFLLFRDRFSFWATALGYPVLSFTLALFVAAAAMWEPPSRMWSVPGAEFIAKISFSLYLTHKIAFHLAKVNFASIDAAGGLYALVLYSAAALVAGSALYFCIEFPFLWLREKIMNRPKLPLSPQPQCVSVQIR